MPSRGSLRRPWRQSRGYGPISRWMATQSWKILIFNPPDCGGHSPNHAALETRKTCQNDEFPDIFAPLTSCWLSHICPRRCDGYRAISLALLDVGPRIVELPLIWRTLPDRGLCYGTSRSVDRQSEAARHG